MTTKELCEELCILGAKMTIPQDTNNLQVRKQEIIKELEASIRKEVVDKAINMITYERSFDERGKDQFSKGAVKAYDNILSRINGIDIK